MDYDFNQNRAGLLTQMQRGQSTVRTPHKLSDGFCVKTAENGGWVVSHYDRTLGAFSDFSALLEWLREQPA